MEELERRDLFQLAGALGMRTSGSATDPIIVLDLQPDGWAERAGVTKGDRVVALNGVEPAENFMQILKTTRPLTVTFLRAKGPRVVVVGPEHKLLGLRFDFPPAKMKVTDVRPDTWASSIGCRVGDEVISLDNQSPQVALSQAQVEDALKRRPLKLTILFAAEPTPAARLQLQPPIKPDISLVIEPDSDTPRGIAHAALLNALTDQNHDAPKLAEALRQARAVGLRGDGIDAAQQALEVMGGPNAVGPAERRRQALRRAEAALSQDDAHEIRATVEAAIEAGVDDPHLLEAAEIRLSQLYVQRSGATDKLLDALEAVVTGAELSKGQGCPKAQLVKLSIAIEEAQKLSSRGDEELLALVSRVLTFESQRAAALSELDKQIKERCDAMDRIMGVAVPSTNGRPISVASEAAANVLDARMDALVTRTNTLASPRTPGRLGLAMKPRQ